MPVEVLVNLLIPVLLGLMVVEYLVARWQGRAVYGHRQTLGNLATAVGHRAVAVGFGLVPLLGYPWLEERVGLVVYGTVDGLPTYDALQNNLAPWRKMVRRMRAAPDAWTALQIPLRAPGWRQPAPVLASVDQRFPKRRVFPSVRSRIAGTGVLLACVGGAVALGAWSEPLGWTGRLALAGAVVLGLVAAGWFLEDLVASALDTHDRQLAARVQATTWSGALLEQASLLAAGLYRALREAGCDDAEARQWTGEATWAVWSRITALPWALTRWRADSAQERLERTVAATRTFLAPPDFGVREVDAPAAFEVTRCPMREVFAAEGLEHVWVDALCALDERVAEARGLRLDRSGTLAGGAECCDFAWEVEDAEGRAAARRRSR